VQKEQKQGGGKEKIQGKKHGELMSQGQKKKHRKMKKGRGKTNTNTTKKTNKHQKKLTKPRQM